MRADRSVYVERLLQINLAAMASLGTLMLGMGQQSALMPIIVLCIAACSVWLTDIAGVFRLNRTAANVGALAIGITILTREFSRFGSEAHILGVARLLVYLQVLLLLQEKRQREYWQLAVLSLLQVVVAAAFAQGVWFGVVLVVYMLAGLSCLTLLFLNRQWASFASSRPAAATDRRTKSPRELNEGKNQGNRTASAPVRWPLTSRQGCFVGGAVDDSASGVGWPLICRLGVWSTGTLALTALVFLTVPRFGQSAWRGAIVAQQNVVGFSNQVTLGELGETIEDPKEVLRVRFCNNITGQTHPVSGPVYLHGGLLMSYRRGQWTAGSALASVGYESLRPLSRPLPPDLVRQELTIEPLHQQELFCVMPFVPVERNDAVQIDFRRKRLLREGYLCGRRFSYVLGTTAMANGRQLPLTPGEGRRPDGPSLDLPDGQDSLPSVVGLAQEWLDQSGIDPLDHYGRAKHLEHMLGSSGLFRYSLKGQPRDPNLDPIEDFLTQNRAGHCEYFATALALMLRSQGIPARVAIGYMTDEYNEAGRFFQVRQLHAHAWVEAYLAPDRIPPSLLHGQSLWAWSQTGGWLQLDATPAGGEDGPDGLRLTPWRLASLWMDQMWSNYILEMDRPRQHEAIYQPVLQAVKRVYAAATDRAWWRDLFAAWSNVGRWFSWRGGLAAMLLMAMGVGAHRVGRALWRWAGPRLWPRSARFVDDDGRVEFYGRLVTLLRRRGLRRSPSQTPYEFAETAAARLAATPGDEHLAGCPRQVVLAFYQVRFGHEPLDSRQLEAVEYTLSELQKNPDFGA